MLMGLVAVVIHVEASDKLPGWLGRAAQAWLLDQVRHADPALARVLHGDKGQSSRRPYTVSAPRQEGDQVWLRITSANDDLSATLIEHLLPPLQAIMLTKIALKVIRVEIDSGKWAGQSTFEKLAQEAFDRPVRTASAMEFSTPTAFHRAGLSVPLPLPELVFGSLVQAWNQFSPVALPVTMSEFVGRCVGIAKHRISTRMVAISGQERQVGFMGNVEYMVLPQEKSGYNETEYRVSIQTLDLLTRFAFYAGVGVRTTVGMGQVRSIAG